jgi:hypothetical protein
MPAGSSTKIFAIKGTKEHEGFDVLLCALCVLCGFGLSELGFIIFAGGINGMRQQFGQFLRAFRACHCDDLIIFL